VQEACKRASKLFKEEIPKAFGFPENDWWSRSISVEDWLMDQKTKRISWNPFERRT
jgi:hypothetical protein